MAKEKWDGEVLRSYDGMGYCLRYRVDDGLMYMEVNGKRISAARPLAGKTLDGSAEWFLGEYVAKQSLK